MASKMTVARAIAYRTDDGALHETEAEAIAHNAARVAAAKAKEFEDWLDGALERRNDGYGEYTLDGLHEEILEAWKVERR